ncbi:hypothetical protein C8F04DRAFT_1211833 [Mycena alexandri]|uniref:Uncharacterized protein n=1 Tax=Mycena alexandri TaxID=1745969 RepID=A0AAD6X089_9AGAR|nr:hypothetical protein C8F04DRAFT_1211833 [Mycena alexandri]
MSLSPEAQDSLFAVDPANKVPHSPSSYVVVGVYRLFTDKVHLLSSARSAHALTFPKLLYTFLTFGVQKKFIEFFLANSPRVTGLSNDTMFGYKIPFNVHTYAAVLLLGSQITNILRFLLSRNIRIARERAWEQTVASRGKGPDFWLPYVEEWKVPPRVVVDTWTGRFEKQWLGGVTLLIIKRVLLVPFNFYPGVGILLAAWFKALATAHSLHRQYFSAKKMTDKEIAVFMEERKWDYRAFGFTAALLEGLPIVGLIFTISNRVGAAMWAHDLEKRQHFVAASRSQERKL